MNFRTLKMHQKLFSSLEDSVTQITPLYASEDNKHYYFKLDVSM